MSLPFQRPTLLPSTTPESMFSSPKRKREADDPTDLNPTPSPTRLRTSSFPTSSHTPDDDVNGDRSPRSTVAGHFQNLNLTGYGFDFTQTMEKPSSARIIADSQDTDLSSSQGSIQTLGSQPTPPDTPITSVPTFGSITTPTSLPLEIPETPRLKPTTMPSPAPSPLPRCKSPPAINLWWADAEITGHDPKDPTDDGYGINGVGFIPTPAMASARAERRKKQVAEWKNREAREARQRRSEARRRRDFEMTNKGLTASEGSLGGRQQRRVRFLEV
ncbi:MAG: hypothetical protein Q9213_003179 [Squamulea squamosa]